MLIKLSPVRMDEQLTLDREGDVLWLNGEQCDLGPLLEGETLPAEAISSKWFAGQVDRVNGELELTIILPHGPNAPESTRFPLPVTVTENAPVNLPVYDIAPEAPEALPVEGSEVVEVGRDAPISVLEEAGQ